MNNKILLPILILVFVANNLFGGFQDTLSNFKQSIVTKVNPTFSSLSHNLQKYSKSLGEYICNNKEVTFGVVCAVSYLGIKAYKRYNSKKTLGDIAHKYKKQGYNECEVGRMVAQDLYQEMYRRGLKLNN
ncbi:hypothetical protein [Candidatus Babela massiliensis]|uniref:Uncharacterized protein n=1 Tax=Candidatus Babela massiliensis TaxID=673862 RepID=V6DK91_9BACT|nr:hypothetical protein [Candidatus Babela massiliensis]CDK30946.1 hypothetical protein BABL1_gene_80 [Candidatus Babela massiliensis]